MSDKSPEPAPAVHVRRPLNQHEPAFHDTDDLNRELARVFDICHGCRRCVNLCNTFPVLFDLIDQGSSGEVDGVNVADYQRVVDQCYLCDLCYRSKCPYVPPHEWNMDFPQTMLRAKAVRFRQQRPAMRDRLITSTGMIGRAATLPLVNPVVNTLAHHQGARRALQSALGIHKDARLPPYTRPTLRQRFQHTHSSHGQEELIQNSKEGFQHSVPNLEQMPSQPAVGHAHPPTVSSFDDTDHKTAAHNVMLFSTCYCNFNEPEIGDSLYRVLRHNGAHVALTPRETCCGMPKLELGDLPSVDVLTRRNMQVLYPLAEQGWIFIAAVPSCVLMFRETLPRLYPEDEQVKKVAAAFRDPFEFLHQLHRRGNLNLSFKRELGSVSYHVACHQRAQEIGPRTQQILELIPGTRVQRIERCSGHNGTYAVKTESHETANRIAAPVVKRVLSDAPDYLGSDCPMAARHIEARLAKHDARNELKSHHPLQLLCKAYDI